MTTTGKLCVGTLATAILAMPTSAPAHTLDEMKAERTAGTTRATILNVSDFHGNLQPATPPGGGEKLGGAAYLATHFATRAALAEHDPFLVTAGDAVGATPPLSAHFADNPTIEVMNMMGFDADTLGNHNFDHGVAHMKRLAAQADFPYLVANLMDRRGRTPSWVQESTTWTVGGTTVGITGAINEDAPSLLKPGSLGRLVIEDTAEALNAEASELEARGINTIVALVHYGAEGVGDSGATGPLIDLASRLQGIDVLIGDHTNLQVDQSVQGADGKAVWVVENFSKGISFSEIDVVIDNETGETVRVAARFFPSLTRGVTPDPAIKRYIDGLEAEVGPLVDEVVGHSHVPVNWTIPWAESNQGNLVADALRETFGTDFAVVNSGALRTDLTRSDDRETAGPYRIRRRHILEMMPFQNSMVTVEVSGVELRSILENGVAAQPRPDGRFIQVSGLEFDYRTSAPVGERVVEVRWHATDDPVDLSETVTYSVAMNDFMALGGDGYPSFDGRFVVQGLLDWEAVAGYLARSSPVSPEGPVSPAMVPATRIFRLD